MMRKMIIIQLLVWLVMIPNLIFAQTDTLHISLNEAINLALQQNLSLQQIDQELIVQEKNYQQAKTSFSPTLDFSTSYNKIFIEETPLRSDNSQQTSFNLSWYLWQGGSRLNNLELQKTSQEITQTQKQNTLEQTLYAVITAYLELLQAQKQLVVINESLELAQQSHKQTEAMLAVGTSKKSDLLRAKVEVSQQESNLISAQNAVEDAQTALCNILNIKTINIYPIEPEFAEITLPPFTEIVQNIKTPQIAMSELSLKSTEIQTKSVKSKFHPNISMNASTNWSGTNFEYQEPEYSWGMRLSWSIFDGGSRYYELQEAKANEKVAYYELESTIQDVITQIEIDYRKVKTTITQWKSTKHTLALSQESYNQIAAMYKLGLATSLELFEAQNTLNEAKLDEMNNYYAIYTTYAKLAMDLGELEQNVKTGIF